MSAEYTYDRQCLYRDGKPWFPVMGEMHFTRYRRELWEESLRKMKAGGVCIVATYMIWIHHEEERGVFDFDGCRDVRYFLELCGGLGLKAFLRLGPWTHGESRNGGFPDWLVKLGGEGMELRSNDEDYLSCVREYWARIAEQTSGMMDKDGGPVIGIQIENEYGHAGGLRGERGNAHMRTLRAMAEELGFEVPLYTATGWGGAVIGDALPVMGGYCDAPWDPGVGELAASPNFIICRERDGMAAGGLHPEYAPSFNESDYPYLTAELGGGLQPTAHRRPVGTAEDVGAMSIAKLASGASLLGYYMYHGGSNPKGRLSTLQESRESGYDSDLPEISYDFSAPIGQYGSITDSYKEIRLLAMFLRDFGEDLAPLPAYIDEEAADPEDTHILRWSVRHDGSHGYVFYNNYVRRRVMDGHEMVSFSGPCMGGDAVLFPPVDIPGGAYGFFPYNMRLGDAVLVSALATPLCKLSGGGADTYVFYGDNEPSFAWKDGKEADVLHLTRSQARDACPVTLDRDYLIITDGYVWEEGGRLKVSGPAKTKILSWPELSEVPDGFSPAGAEGIFSTYVRERGGTPAAVSFEEGGRGVRPAGPGADSPDPRTALMQRAREWISYRVRISYPEKPGALDRLSGRDTWLVLDYTGFGVEIWADGEKIDDHFYTGRRLPLSLGYFDFPEELTVKVYALYEDDRVYLERWPRIAGSACALDGVSVEEEYR